MLTSDTFKPHFPEAMPLKLIADFLLLAAKPRYGFKWVCSRALNEVHILRMWRPKHTPNYNHNLPCEPTHPMEIY